MKKRSIRTGTGVLTNLLVIADTEYSFDEDGHPHTLVALSKQLDIWFAEFDEVVICAHLRPGPPPDDHRRLAAPNVTFVALPRAGGIGIRSKVGVVVAMALWVRVLIPYILRATAVHLRAPCNVTLVAIPLTAALKRRRYAIYAGNWEPRDNEPLTYRAQRRMLRSFGGVVHAYIPIGTTGGRHIRPNVSPSFTNRELQVLQPVVDQRERRFQLSPTADRPLRICCIATFTPQKNHEALIHALALLNAEGIETELRLAGSGPERINIERQVQELGLSHIVQFLGQIGDRAVLDLLAWADVNALITFGEGFGKVYIEGMAVGCPAVCGSGAMQRAIIGNGKRGRQTDPARPESVAAALRSLKTLPPGAQLAMTRACREFAAGCTLEVFRQEIRTIVYDLWKLPERRPSGG